MTDSQLERTERELDDLRAAYPAPHRHSFYLTGTRTLRSGLVVYIGKCECGDKERITYTGRAI